MNGRPGFSAADMTIRSARRIVLISHARPDGDAVGSSMGLAAFLESRGQEAVPVFPDRFPDSLGWLDPEGKSIFYDESPEEAGRTVRNADLIICLDFNRFSRANGLGELAASAPAAKIVIDHHPDPDREAFSQVYSEPGRSSTCETVYFRLLECEGVDQRPERLPFRCLEALAAGLLTDTNNFSNSAGPDTFRMASDLCRLGIRFHELSERLFRNNRRERIVLLGYLLSRKLQEIPEEEAAYMILTLSEQRRFDYRPGETEGFVNIPLQTSSVRISALFTETDEGYVRVSLRSKTGYSVNGLARASFNGGGHENAAGGKLFLPVAEIPRYFEQALRDFRKREAQDLQNSEAR